MSLAIVHTRALAGIKAPPVTVEVHLSRGLPAFNIVGLAETAVKESKDRVRSAIINSGLELPVKRMTVNLAPADLPKEGGRFDLPIALGILAASEQIPCEALDDYEFAAELALTGDLRPIRGALPFAMACAAKKRKLIVASANANEATLVSNIQVYGSSRLHDVCSHLKGDNSLTPHLNQTHTPANLSYPDLQDVAGQEQGKRALEIAAAGGHSLLFVGPPGTGKTMLSSRLPGILPPLSESQATEVAAIYSISRGGFDPAHWRQRPYRAPHHTSSSVALVGGGRPPMPGEISLAHHGVLFLDELPEYQRQLLEALREPLESKAVTISRASYQSVFPAQFQLIAAMNPCPCGYLTDPDRNCECTPQQIARYSAKISGPMLDRIDLYVDMPRLPQHLMFPSQIQSESSSIIRKRVIAAHQRQLARTQRNNAGMQSDDLKQYCSLSKADQKYLENALTKLQLTARALHRTLKTARTIADLACEEQIGRQHLQEALSYRPQQQRL